MNRHRMAWIVPAILFFAACSSEPQKPAGGAHPAAKPAAKPTETLTGREAFQKLYPPARGWNADAKPIRFETQLTTDASGQDGKAAIWRVGFASPNRRVMEAFIWSGSTASDLDRGVSHGTEDGFSPTNASTQPFDLNFLKIDSDAAFQTAQKHGGDKILKKDPKTPILYLLDWDMRKNQLVWHVIYGENRNDAKLVVDSDATTGEFLRVEK